MRKLLLSTYLLACAVLPARAGLMPSAVLFHPVTGDTSLAGISGIGALADLDATQTGSTDGVSQTWSNLVVSPGDGSASSAYSFYRGTSNAVDAADPAFTGTAGNSGAYWAFNGSTDFTLTGANSSFLSALQNDGQSFWIAMTFNLGSTGTQTLWSTQSSSSSAGLSFTCAPTATTKFTLTQYTTSTKQIVGYSPAFTVGNDYVVVVSHVAGGDTRVWFNTTTNAESTVLFTAGSVTAAHTIVIGARGGSNPIGASSKVRSFAMGNVYLTDAQAASIIHRLEARQQIDYDGNGSVGG